MPCPLNRTPRKRKMGVRPKVGWEFKFAAQTSWTCMKRIHTRIWNQTHGNLRTLSQIQHLSHYSSVGPMTGTRVTTIGCQSGFCKRWTGERLFISTNRKALSIQTTAIGCIGCWRLLMPIRVSHAWHRVLTRISSDLRFEQSHSDCSCLSEPARVLKSG